MCFMHDYNVLVNNVLRGLAQADAATVDNVFACLVDSANHMRAASVMIDSTVINSSRKQARNRLNRAAQYLWGSYPPEGIKVNDQWEYSIRS